jgi:hypothetical protein
VLLTDNEKCWAGTEFASLLAENDITHLYFPPLLGHLMNPCDNSFHSSYKLKIQQKLVDFPTLTRKEKLHIIEDAYYSCDELSIQAIFKHCGIIDRNPVKTMRQLVTEGVHPRSKFTDLHAHQLDEYKKWVAVTEYNDPQDSHPEQLADITLQCSKRLASRLRRV